MGKFRVPTSCKTMAAANLQTSPPVCRELAEIGFVTQALWFDLDKDGNKDCSLVWSGEVLSHS